MMKLKFNIIIFSIIPLIMNAQLLSVEESLEYISHLANSELHAKDCIHSGVREIDLSVNSSGNIIIRYEWHDNKDILFPQYRDATVNYNEFELLVNDLSGIEKKTLGSSLVVAVFCKDGTKNCVKVNEEAILWQYSSGFFDRPNALNHYDFVSLYYANTKKDQQNICAGLVHLLNELKEKKDEQLHEHSSFDKNKISNKDNLEVIQLHDSEGVSYLTISMGGLPATFILDSGASDISVPTSFEQKLLSSDIISSSNYLKPGLYAIADGSVIQSNRFVIPYIIIKGLRVENVTCSTNPSEEMYLLGKSFLDRFKSWKINNEFNQLILEY